MIDKLAGSLQVQAKALELRAERQSLLAANVANADTPGYKAVDIDFRKALEQAVRPAAANAPAPSAAFRPLAFSPVQRDPAQAAQDANGVDLDLERARFAENAVGYEAALRTLNHQVKSLLTVIQG